MTPTWSCSLQKWLNASEDYIKAQSDIIDELKGLNYIQAQNWAIENNADFEIVG